MRKTRNVLLSILIALLLVPGNLFAEAVRGEVTAINTQNQSVSIAAQDDSGNIQESKEFLVRSDAEFSGIQSLDDLEVGDEIQVDIRNKIFGKDEVTQLSSTKPIVDQTHAPGFTAPAPAVSEKANASATVQSTSPINTVKTMPSTTYRSTDLQQTEPASQVSSEAPETAHSPTLS